MARRGRFRLDEESSSPAWLITFSDLMTLLLTFFVLLVSMATIDERAKLRVLSSMASEFGFAKSLPNPTALGGRLENMTPGRMDTESDDLEPLKDKIFDDVSKDLDFQENKYVQIFSISNDVLFSAGGIDLSPQGIELLDKLIPYLQQIQYPLLVAGHTGSRRDEEGDAYRVMLDPYALDSTWQLSLDRALAVYRHFLTRGIDPGRLSIEGFGAYRPRFSNYTPEGRKRNRRVDLVLDKRNKEWIDKVGELRERLPEEKRELYYQGFKFDVSIPSEGQIPGR